MDYIVIDNRGANAQSFGQLRRHPTWTQTAELFKLSVREDKGWAVTPPGESCWRFIGVTLNEGPTIYRVQVRDIGGNLRPDILVFRHYSGAPLLPGAVKPDYYVDAEAVFTASGGDKFGHAEFVYGAGSVTKPEGGPDAFWVSVSPNGQPPQFSDLAVGFGWLGGSVHFNPSPIFGEMIKPPTEPPVEPPIVTGRYVLANLDASGRVVGYIPFIDGAPSVNRARLAILDHGRIVGYREWESD